MIREQCSHVDAECRASALRFLGELKDADSASLIASGLLDHEDTVRVAASLAAVDIGLKRATPIFLVNLGSGEQGLRNTTHIALSRLWSTPDNAIEFTSAEQWDTFWEKNAASIPDPLIPEKIKPLVEPGTRFYNE